MRRFLAFLLLAAALTGCTAAPSPSPTGDPKPKPRPTESGGIPVTPGTHRLDLDVPGPGHREYLLHVPPHADGRLPLVLAVHGGASTAEKFEDQSGFDAVSDAEGFLVAYPDGVGFSWNAGPCCGPAKLAKVDDTGFLTRLMDALVKAKVADPDRVFVTGFSNGGGMAYKLACEGPGRVRAFGVVSASLVIACHPSRPVSMMIVHGRKDTSVPFAGGGHRDWNDSRPFAPVSTAVAFWREADGVGALRADGACRAAGRSGVEVRFCPHGGGHVWPDGMARDLWSFFAKS